MKKGTLKESKEVFGFLKGSIWNFAKELFKNFTPHSRLIYVNHKIAGQKPYFP